MNPPPDEQEPDGSDARPDEFWTEDEGPFFAWLPPEDRLWMHPSEAAGRTDRPPARTRRLAALAGSTWAVATVAGLIGAAAATGVGVASGLWPHDTTIVRPAVDSTSEVSMADIGAEPTDWTSIVDSVDPSVVGVTADGGAGQVTGSGLVIAAADGTAYIVTDRSLLAPDMAAGYLGPIDVTYFSGQVDRAKLIGQDALSGLAVLATGDPPGLVRADVGSVAQLDEAASVLAVGSRSVPAISTGSVSGEDLSLQLTDGSQMDDLLAVTMPSLGSSADGGPLLDQYGRVVGLTIGVQPANQADAQFSFAVPGDEVLRVATEMIDGERVTHPWLGVTNATDVPSSMAHTLGLQGGVQAGVVEPGSPAQAAGIHSDDILVAFAGQSLDSTGSLVAALNSCPPGHRVPVTYVHDGRTITTTIAILDEPAGG